MRGGFQAAYICVFLARFFGVCLSLKYTVTKKVNSSSSSSKEGLALEPDSRLTLGKYVGIRAGGMMKLCTAVRARSSVRVPWGRKQKHRGKNRTR